MTDNFAYFLPFTLAIFAVAQWLALRWGASRSALFWALGFGGSALGFGAPLLPLPPPLMAILAEAAFVSAFFCYGEAITQRFGLTSFLRWRLGFAILAFAGLAYVIFIAQSLSAELLLSDLACGLLLGVPLVRSLRKARHVIDRALQAITAVIVLDTLRRVVMLTTMVAPGAGIDDFLNGDYMIAMQTGAIITAVIWALLALASTVLDVVGQYRDAAERDALTGLLNRRGFERMVDAATRDRKVTGAIIAWDIDRFKSINDVYGHSTGDKVLSGIAALLAKNLPQEAIAARFGGEEFITYLPRHTMAEAAVFAHMSRLVFAAQVWAELGIDRQITASFGVASLWPADKTIHDAIARADAALYAAKRAGRNQVMLEGEQPYEDPSTFSRESNVSSIR